MAATTGGIGDLIAARRFEEGPRQRFPAMGDPFRMPVGGPFYEGVARERLRMVEADRPGFLRRMQSAMVELAGAFTNAFALVTGVRVLPSFARLRSTVRDDSPDTMGPPADTRLQLTLRMFTSNHGTAESTTNYVIPLQVTGEPESLRRLVETLANGATQFVSRGIEVTAASVRGETEQALAEYRREREEEIRRMYEAEQARRPFRAFPDELPDVMNDTPLGEPMPGAFAATAIRDDVIPPPAPPDVLEPEPVVETVSSAPTLQAFRETERPQ